MQNKTNLHRFAIKIGEVFHNRLFISGIVRINTAIANIKMRFVATARVTNRKLSTALVGVFHRMTARATALRKGYAELINNTQMYARGSSHKSGGVIFDHTAEISIAPLLSKRTICKLSHVVSGTAAAILGRYRKISEFKNVRLNELGTMTLTEFFYISEGQE